MSEARKVRLRLLFLALLAANIMMLAYLHLRADPQQSAAARIEELQINPARVKLLGAATRGPGGVAAAGQGPNEGSRYRACLEWGPFSGAEVSKAESALARLSLAEPPIQRPLAEVEGVKRFAYFVREPNAGIVAQIAELQRSFAGTEIKAGPCPG